MFHKMPFILLAIIVVMAGASPWIPESAQSILYAVSLSIKSLIVAILPFVVFGLLFKTAAYFAGRSSKMILVILAAICASNFLSTLLSYGVGTLAYQLDISLSFPSGGEALQPAWDFYIPKWIGNGQAMLSGILTGGILGWQKPQLAKIISHRLDRIVNVILQLILVLIPAFIAGFIVKMSHDQVMAYILQNYGFIFAVIGLSVLSYIFSIYLFVNQFSLNPTFKNIKNILPAAIAGFGSMSSAASMPLTILGAEKNARNPDVARSIIPATVNVHLIGDCFAIPIFAFAVMKSFGIEGPSLGNYLIFSSFFVLAKFSVAAVPGGGILVMLPILESYLGFNAEMLSLITALYILFDPVITFANILGNGGFALGFEKFISPVKISTESTVL